MALLHSATLTPSKAELLSSWVPVQPWFRSGAAELDLVGAYRFDDPEGRVGMEVHLVATGDLLMHVPLTYRDRPRPDEQEGLVGTLEHSTLGTRWVYDGLTDPAFTRMLAAVSWTGVGQALGMVEHDGRWLVVPPTVRLHGGGGAVDRVVVDGFEPAADEGTWAVLRSARFELRVSRLPTPGPQPAVGLTATWPGQAAPVVLTELRDR